jgi:hypothetical protein
MWDKIRFYNLMRYPTPTESNIYTYINENSSQNIWASQTIQEEKSFSRDQKWEFMDEYREYINQWSWIWRHIPCVRKVYLCNSITFNALHNNSDIDLCIITRSQYIRFARTFSWIFTKLIWLQRKKGKYSNNRKKFCLSFYIDEWHTNISHLRKRQWDVYLSYWVAHTVLLYSDMTLSDSHLIETNKKLLSFLPYHPPTQSIYIETTVIRDISYFKKIVEFVLCNPLGKIIQYSIKLIRWTILEYKKSNLSSHTQKEIIISPYMLKFHQDKRDIIQNKRKIATAKE